jgi:hypothetical protein
VGKRTVEKSDGWIRQEKESVLVRISIKLRFGVPNCGGGHFLRLRAIALALRVLRLRAIAPALRVPPRALIS